MNLNHPDKNTHTQSCKHGQPQRFTTKGWLNGNRGKLRELKGGSMVAGASWILARVLMTN